MSGYRTAPARFGFCLDAPPDGPLPVRSVTLALDAARPPAERAGLPVVGGPILEIGEGALFLPDAPAPVGRTTDMTVFYRNEDFGWPRMVTKGRVTRRVPHRRGVPRRLRRRMALRCERPRCPHGPQLQVRTAPRGSRGLRRRAGAGVLRRRRAGDARARPDAESGRGGAELGPGLRFLDGGPAASRALRCCGRLASFATSMPVSQETGPPIAIKYIENNDLTDLSRHRIVQGSVIGGDGRAFAPSAPGA